ncbi:MAG: alkaline shock response membrane anchor protein AmaP [Clostridia bacterium]|nr:alkaline shock response membrane anchor protein AmaP [Clostridia bacterium]
MKLNVGKRILMFFHWLFSLLICAAFAVYLIAPDLIMPYYDSVKGALGDTKMQIIGIAILAVYAILAIAQIILIFKRRKRAERGFITVDSSDTGRVRIAISAIEQMVRQAVYDIDGLNDMKIAIENEDDAIGIKVRATIQNGSHVPTITMNMQRAIRQFVETNCGVAVRSVLISINAVSNESDASRRKRKDKIRSKSDKAPEKADGHVVDQISYLTPEKAPEPEPRPEPEPVRQPLTAPWSKVVDNKPESVYYGGNKAEPESEPAPVEEKPVAEETPAEPEMPVFRAPEAEQPAVETPAEPEPYDFDKPYVSEFAKDLAALKAKEAMEDSEGPATVGDEEELPGK